MASKPTIAIVGPGRLGSALATRLTDAGYKVTEIIARSASARRNANRLAGRTKAKVTYGRPVRLDANVVWFCVPDRQIASAARELAKVTGWKRKIALHSSGALSHGELDALQKRGASTASVHPLMTFVEGVTSSLEGVPFAIEGERAAVHIAREIVRKLGGVPFTINKRMKVAYHAWGAFVSPLLIATLVTAEQVARLAGIKRSEARKKVLPIVHQTVANYAALGPAGAFSGPLVRGDTEIVRRHLQALRNLPQARDVYLVLAKAALRYLPVRQREALRRALSLQSPKPETTRRNTAKSRRA